MAWLAATLCAAIHWTLGVLAGGCLPIGPAHQVRDFAGGDELHSFTLQFSQLLLMEHLMSREYHSHGEVLRVLDVMVLDAMLCGVSLLSRQVRRYLLSR
ncbi:hypothetical protein F4780DRAFT_738979 [Xylariomycetidae sp. FL0641]|nr:hypothetical protein F4780DRAFT_738979 [Xylariomycetidae sp. FL0641]